MSDGDVTVVIPVRDRADLLCRALASVAAQTIQPASVWVVDDGSADGSGAVARARGARVIRLDTARGPGVARNAGLAASKTTWVAFLDSDDLWAPEHLASLLRAARPESVLVTAPGVTSKGRWRGNPAGRDVSLDRRSLLVLGDGIVTSSTMVRRVTAVEAGGFPDQPLAQDLGLWLRLLARGPGVQAADPTCYYLVHDGQRSAHLDGMRAAHEATVEAEASAWLTNRLRSQYRSRLVWDELRAQPSPRCIARGALWYARRPSAVLALAAVLSYRRRGRRAAARRSGADLWLALEQMALPAEGERRSGTRRTERLGT